MRKLLMLYILLLFTACTENGPIHHRGKTSGQTSAMCVGTPKQAVAGPGLVISVIVNREIALHETTPSFPNEDEFDENDFVNTAASELP